jgi:copper chaperone CopZ
MGIKNTTLEVGGMTCGSCVRHVEHALRGLDGITSVEVKLRERRAVVAHDPERATAEAMIAALEGAGYTATATGA